MKRAYIAYVLGILGLYGMVTVKGWDLASEKRGFIPASVRQSPGGYRSFTYWRGGK
jgi:hypothetical protein